MSNAVVRYIKNVLWIRTPVEEIDHFIGLYNEIVVVLADTAQAQQLGLRVQVSAALGMGRAIQEKAMGICGFITDRYAKTSVANLTGKIQVD